MRATLFFCSVALLPQVDVMGDVVNYVVLAEEESEYASWGFAVMCTSAAACKDSDALAQQKNRSKLHRIPAFAFTFRKNYEISNFQKS